MNSGHADGDSLTLQTLFKSLSETRHAVAKLHEQPFIAAIGAIKVSLINAGVSFCRKAVVDSAFGGLTQPRLTYLSGLRRRDGIIRYAGRFPHSLFGVVGHQYSTSYPSEDAIVGSLGGNGCFGFSPSCR